MLKALKLEFVEKYRDLGLLIMRLGLGVSFMVHGWPKMLGGPQKWAALGETFGGVTGLQFMPEFWGFVGALIELGGGALLILGLLMRPAAFFLCSMMAVAMMMHINAGDGFGGFSHPLEAMFTFIGLFFVGPGKFSLDHRLR